MDILGKHSYEVYKILLKVTGAGPFDGGCVCMARALQLVYGGELYVLESRYGATHCVVRLGDKLIDGDGIADIGEFIESYQKRECCEISGYRLMNDGDLSDCVRDESCSLRISKLLTVLKPDSEESP